MSPDAVSLGLLVVLIAYRYARIATHSFLLLTVVLTCRSFCELPTVLVKPAVTRLA